MLWPVRPFRRSKLFIPKQEIALIVELKSPETLPALEYKTKAGD